MKNADRWQPSKFIVEDGQLRISAGLAVSARRMARYTAKFYNESIPRFCKGQLLDLGCGTVPLYELFRDYANEIYCVEWSNSLNDLLYVDQYCDLNKKLPFEDSSFDTIILADVIEHLEDPFQTLSEAYRILKPGGNLILNFPFLYGLHELPHDFGRYTNLMIRRWANRIGFEVTVEKAYGGYLDQLEHSLLRIARKVRGGRYFARGFSFSFSSVHETAFFKRINCSNETHPYAYGFVLTKG